MPFILLALVYVPLRRALDEVAWQVRVRAAIREALAREPSRVVQSRVRVERHEVEVVVVLLGSTKDADTARKRLGAAIHPVSGVTPHLEIFAVPDAASFAGLESTLLTPHAVTQPVTPAPSADEQLDAARKRIRGVVERLWPTTTAGEPLVINVGTAETGPLRIRVVHIGQALSTDGSEALRRAVESGLDREARLVNVAVPPGELTREGGDLALVAKVASAVRATAGVPSISVCVLRPEPPAPAKTPVPSDLELARALEQALAAHPRVTTTAGSSWAIRFVRGECDSPTPADAGVPDASSSE